MTRSALLLASLLLASLPLLAGTPARAHGPATAGSAPPRPAHGGIVVVADGHPIEMVVTDKVLTFHVDDEDGKPLDTKGTSGRAFVTQGGKTATVALSPSPTNALSGPLPAPLAAGAKIVFSARLHGHNLQARFERK